METLNVANRQGGIDEGLIDGVHKAVDSMANIPAILVGSSCPGGEFAVEY
jgi:hypothetical protein